MKFFFLILSLYTFSLLSAYNPNSYEFGLGYDFFRSLPEGDWEGNTGALATVNICTQLPYLKDLAIGAQVGGSYGVYDFSGRGSSASNRQTKVQQQAFATGAIFRRTACYTGYNYGLAYDWMWNKNASVFALQYAIAQLRFQGGILLDPTDECGVWGTLDVHTAHRKTQGIDVAFRAISQVNLFWEHRFGNSSRTMVWAGIPYKKSLMFSTGRAGRFIVGANFHAPLNYCLSLDGHACYMQGHSAKRALKQRTFAANICVELTWAFGKCNWVPEPYMSIGNNSNFLTDTNITF